MSFLFLSVSVFLLYLAFYGKGLLADMGVPARLIPAFMFFLFVSHAVDLSVSVGWIMFFPLRMAAAFLSVWYFLSVPMQGWMRYRAAVGAFLFAVLFFFARRQAPEAIDRLLDAAPYLFSGAAAALSFALCKSPAASVGCCALSLSGMEIAFALADHAAFGGMMQMFAGEFCPLLLTGLLLTVLLNDALLLLCPEPLAS